MNNKEIDPSIYPKNMKKCKGHDFNSFVAYDFETTGLSSIDDEIIEIGAIKVIDGKVVEDEEHKFQLLIKPKHKRISSFITNLTGTSNEDVKDSPYIDEVLPTFLKWCEDLPMIGYNSTSFDSKFLLQAARENCIYIDNESFDVIYFARSKHLCVENYRLTTVAKHLHITNPRVHRAYADAYTTAMVFLKLKEM